MSPRRNRSRTFRKGRGGKHGHAIEGSRCGDGRHGLDRRHHCARAQPRPACDVVGLERGQDRTPGEDFILPGVRDEMKYSQRLELMSDNSIDTITFRNEPAERALPIRRWGAFLPGEGVGGSGIHWGGLHWRNLPADFRIRSALTERYGAKAIPDDMTIADWPVSYAELEPYYDRFDKLCGVSGKAGNLRGQTVAGGNPFEGPRSYRLSQQAGEVVPCRRAVRRGRAEPRLSPVPGADRDRERGLPEQRGGCARRLRVLRLSATAWPARPTPRRRPIPPSCRCCATSRSSSCARGLT